MQIDYSRNWDGSKKRVCSNCGETRQTRIYPNMLCNICQLIKDKRIEKKRKTKS